MSQSKFGQFLSFKLMITPVVVLVLFWLGIATIVLTAIAQFTQGKTLIGLGVIVLGPFAWRIVCEFVMVTFRMHDCLEKIAGRPESESMYGRDSVPAGQGSSRNAPAVRRRAEYGVLLSEISVGGRFETRDGREFKVVEFTSTGLRVEFASGTSEILAPDDLALPEESWQFDIRPS